MFIRSLVLLAFLTVATPVVFADEAPMKEEAPSPFDFGFDTRLRLTSWDNAIDLSDDVDTSATFTRVRSRIFGAWRPTEDLEVALKLTNEFRYFLDPEDVDFTWDEVVIDHLHVRWKDALGTPLSLDVGRQNLMFGDGFVMWDSSPLDGSRTAYFNALRLDWRVMEEGTLTLFGVYQPTEDGLPVINDQERLLIEQPENALGAYFSGTFGETITEAYFISKRVGTSDLNPDSATIHTMGGRAVVPVGDGVTATGEAALQTGWGSDPRLAFGGQAFAAYATEWTRGLPQVLKLGAIYLSGDDPDTSRQEGWDPVFSRWPKWSESYIYTLIREGGVAYWSNFGSLWVGAGFEVSDALRVDLTAHHLMAPEAADPAAAFPGGDGHTRGQLLIGKVSYRIDENTTGHFLWEGFFPGSYYEGGADAYSWLRFELMVKF